MIIFVYSKWTSNCYENNVKWQDLMEEFILKEAMDYFEEDTVYIVEVSFYYLVL